VRSPRELVLKCWHQFGWHLLLLSGESDCHVFVQLLFEFLEVDVVVLEFHVGLETLHGIRDVWFKCEFRVLPDHLLLGLVEFVQLVGGLVGGVGSVGPLAG